MIPFEQAVSLKQGKGLVQSAQTSIFFCILIYASKAPKAAVPEPMQSCKPNQPVEIQLGREFQCPTGKGVQ